VKPRRAPLRQQSGLTLIEVVVVMAIVGLLVMAVLPGIGNTVANSRARSAVNQFMQDFAWARSQAASTNHSEQLTLNADCTWTMVQDVGDATLKKTLTEHSMSSSELNVASGFSCVASNGLSLPQQFNFNGGIVRDGGGIALSGNLRFTSSTGQAWALQLFNSGTLIAGNAS
jgi:prepilin-type N-terminal cleavage/methylation domain-containing protein